MEDTVSGAVDISVDTVSSVAIAGESSLFSFDPIQTMSRKRRKKKLEAMKCWPEVKHMLDNGIPVRDIVHYIQVDRKEYTSVTPASLRTIINQWCGSLVNRNKLIDHRIPVRHLNLINSNNERIDPVDAMNMLFAIQMDRVLIMYQKEQQAGKTYAENTSNLKLATDMLRILNDMMQTDPRAFGRKVSSVVPATNEGKMDSSLMALDRLKKQFEERYGATAASVMMNPESRNRLFNAVSRIRKTGDLTVTSLIERNTEAAQQLEVKNTQIIEVSTDEGDDGFSDSE